MKGTFSRFIAIAAIVALGVGLLSGLMAMPIDMRTTIDEYFDRQNMHDLRIVSPLGLTDDDVAAIAAVDGVDEVMPAYMTDMFVDAGEKKNIVTRIHSLPTGQIEEKEPENYLNRLDVVEGRLPIQRNECVLVEGNVIDGTGPLSVGNTLTIAATNGDVSGTLADTEFKIVGIVRTSYYFSVDRESATIGDGIVALKMYVGDSLKLDQVKFIDMLGKWKPVEITNEINFELYEIPAEDMVNLPVKNSENDYLEFIHTDGNDIIIPHLTGSLKNFFCNPSGHKVTFDHIEKGLLDWEKDEEYDAPYYIISGANKFFSSQKSEPADVIMGIDKLDDNNIIIYFHEYIPTDFFVSTYNDYDEEFDVDMFGINYKFTRVAE